MQRLTGASLGLALTSILACSSSSTEEGDCAGGKCDAFGDEEPLVSPCDATLGDRSGRGFIPASVADDPFIKKVYMEGDGCPVTLPEVIAKLEKTDANGCVDDGFMAKAGMVTRIVTETAQLMGTSEGASYRAVTSRLCDGREAHELMFSLFGIHGGDPSDPLHVSGSGAPGGLEVMALDETRGVFNFYKEVDGKMLFFGTSTDFITRGPEAPGVTAVRGCANCHPGGSAVMKELASPWMHWEGDFETPGAAEILENRPYLGLKSDGIELETTVRQAHRATQTNRLAIFKEAGDTKRLLEPLFCPIELQLGSQTGSFSPVDGNILGGFLNVGGIVHDQVFGFNSLNVGAGEYEAIGAAIGRHVPGQDSKPDTISAMAHMTRADVDLAYASVLESEGIIDQAFLRDLAFIDMTRPVFSDDRCDLVEFAPVLAPEQLTPENLRQGFIDNIKAAGSVSAAAQDLLARFEASQAGAPDLSAFALGDFVKACQARQDTEKVDAAGTQVGAVLADVVKLVSLKRQLVFERDGALDDASGSAEHPFAILEFPDSLPVDDIQVSEAAVPGELTRVHPKARLDPNTCELRTDYSPVVIDVEVFAECESEFQDTGICIDTDVVECPTFTESGLCPGAANILCCITGGANFGEFGDGD